MKLIMLGMLLTLTGMSAMAATSTHLISEHDRLMLASVAPGPGQSLVYCRNNHCYDVESGETVDFGVTPDGYLLSQPLDAAGEQKDH